jgi:hypothetical protein
MKVPKIMQNEYSGKRTKEKLPKLKKIKIPPFSPHTPPPQPSFF